ncbi:AraC family transcriptional regulator [Mixta hanseatica]|uniref:AraC family transcriptional regulator n=1 Tax=Mixta hanseatica TaxID=2872648 RepID=A0ABY4R6A6_9GAMM|nr:AraC family transcriptional regulator [Mixta hanseatica]UQY43803.1 AraC family transcriptional regulator [Mixta hanseatica]
MQGVPEQFPSEKDRAQFRQLSELPGVELYQAHISRYAFEPHTHEAFGIGAIDFGAERFRYRGANHIAAAQSLVMMNPDELHTGESLGEEGWRYRMIYIDPATLEALTGDRGWWFTEVVKADPLNAYRLSQAIAALWQAPDSLTAHGQILQLVDLFRPWARIADKTVQEKGHRFDIVRDYLRASYAQPVSLAELAGLVSLSPFHFLRQFKRQFHVTPHQMLMAFRLFEAKRLLAQGKCAADVALSVGLTDQAHLTRAFAQRYGITPVRYQKQIAGR